MMYWMFGDNGMNFGHGMGFFMVFFWILIILGFLLMMRKMQGSCGSGGRNEDSAEEILKKRYARGEISEEEFRQMRDQLR